MRRLKRVSSLAATSVIAFSSLLSIGAAPLAHAAATTLYWCGADAGTFSTASNWNTAADCGAGTVASSAPSGGEDLVFDMTTLTSTETVTNDISNLSLSSITFQGSNSGYYGYTLTGSGVTLNGNLTDSGSITAKVSLDVTLGTDSTFSAPNSYMSVSNVNGNQLVAVGNHTLTVGIGADLNSVSGNGTINIGAGASVGLHSSPNWSGSINTASQAFLQMYNADSAGTGTITIADGGNLGFCVLNGATVNNDITVGGRGSSNTIDGNQVYYGALSTYDACGQGGGNSQFDPTASVVLGGTVNLTSNTTVSGLGQLKVTGPLTGNFTLTEEPGQAGNVDIESSSNQSKSPNGVSNSPLQTLNYSANSPSSFVGVGSNTVAVVDGTYGDTEVSDGGTLKGTGTVGKLTVDTGATVAPGHSPGCLNSSDLILKGTYQSEIGGADPCTGYDQLNVTGTVDVTGGTLNVTRYNDFKDFKAGQQFIIINNDGSDAVTGTFSGLAEGATFKLDNGTVLGISYKGGDGNDVVLTVQSVPTTPDTGFALVAAHPMLTLGATVLAAGALVGLAQRSGKFGFRR